jgi:endonuclease-3
VKSKNPLETDKKISYGFTKNNHAMLHNTLVLFGRYNCKARNPECNTCPFSEKCNYFKNSKQNLI